ncbi:hypothetical protein GSI_02710 [Ganoderma sinense ZZ0214-1]|uniref:NADP-dependent oxidoreductase domain-containing protein n=1 Tax=Ganoderma sinense ZZ0214-1 TaxID=1077348 RepID=A0A2G8SMG4_9APHY|nr:hypothetical protein GSI_02710 [Ganoderma sinense ZZ0214-1]
MGASDPHRHAGHLRHPGVGRRKGEPIRAAHGQDAVRDLPGRMEHPPARLRARHPAHGPLRRCAPFPSHPLPPLFECPLTRPSGIASPAAAGLALAPFAVLARGRIRTDEEEERRRQTGEHGRTILRPDWERTERERAVCAALEVVRKQVGTKSIQAVAIAYVMQKAPFVFPVVGGRKKEQLEANIEALDVALSEEQIEYLEGVLPFDPGFPNVMVGDGKEYPWLMNAAANFVKWPRQQAIRP